MSQVIAVGQTWRQEDGYLCRVVAIDTDFAWVRHISGKGTPTQVIPAWFDHWTRVEPTATCETKAQQDSSSVDPADASLKAG